MRNIRRSKPDVVEGDRDDGAQGSKESSRNAKPEMVSVKGIELRQQQECGGLVNMQTRRQHWENVASQQRPRHHRSPRPQRALKVQPGNSGGL